MAGKFALIIGNSHYEDASLGRLKAPDVDVQGLEEVLKAPDVGHFDEVITLLNESGASVRKAVARFYDQRHRDDLLLLYFSGHGVKDEQGHLYLALRDTESKLLAGTAIETAFISGRMDRSFSKRQLLVLDCCHSGAFAHGTKAAQGVSVGTAEAFEGTGLGRVILTATDSTQYAWEGDQVIGDAPNSLFTHFLIKGLKTGAADRNEDGVVTVDELYDYVREQVVNSTPRQTPHKWTYQQQGEIVLAQNPVAKRSSLPPEIEDGIKSKLSSLRLEAVGELETLLGGRHVGRARAALAALKDLALDDSRKVAEAAAKALKTHDEDDRTRTVLPLRTAPPAPTSDIFISYAHEDREKARALANVLTARGWKVWWDRKIAPGEAFDEVIERELGTCKCAIVLWSTRSVHATWVRNEARRAARRKVLVPILIDAVETPLEFENLQAADLTSWQPSVEDPELEAVLDRIQALSPTPHERLARSAVDEARREFGAGRRQAALSRLETFRPPHVLVSRALAELQREAGRILERDRAASVRREEEGAQRQREIVEAARLERERGEAARREEEAAQIAAAARLERERAEATRRQAEAAQRQQEVAEAARLERERAETARREAEAAQRQREIAEAARLERQRAEAARQEAAAAQKQEEIAATARIEREREEATRREAERQRRLDAEKARIEQLAGRRDQLNDGPAFATTIDTFVPVAERHPLDVTLLRAPLATSTAVDPHVRTISWSSSRLVQIAAAVILLLIAGTWLASVWSDRTARGSRNPRHLRDQVVIEKSTPAPASPPVVKKPGVETASVSSLTESAAPKPSPIERVEPKADVSSEGTVVPNKSGDGAAGQQESLPARLERLRKQARASRQAGQRDQALSAVVEGLQIVPKDPALRTMRDSMLTEAREGAARARRDALELEAGERAGKKFGQGRENERAAEKLRREGKIEDATRSFWAAADQFKAAAAESERVAKKEEAAEQALIKSRANEPVAKPVPPTPIQPEPKPLNPQLETEAVTQTLRRYEEAFASLRAEAVRKVYPSTPDELEKDFAAASSYTLRIEIDGGFRFGSSGSQSFVHLASATGRVIQRVVTKSGDTRNSERSVTILLEKPGNTWIITRIR
jgi:TIR domain/Caspase domain